MLFRPVNASTWPRWPNALPPRRWWKYLTAKLTGSFNERADPKVQLEQAIMESQEQHTRLKEQAANVIAIQKQTELQLNRKLDELEKTTGQARQAVIMADDATKRGDATKATEYTRAAEAISTCSQSSGLAHRRLRSAMRPRSRSTRSAT